MRDKSCVVTGQAAVPRTRGPNFTGLEVAHIYPLMGVGVVSTDLRHRIYSSHFLYADWMDRNPVRICPVPSA
jgi:hypothetical protein